MLRYVPLEVPPGAIFICTKTEPANGYARIVPKQKKYLPMRGQI